MGSTCSHCVAAGEDPKGVTFEDAKEFYKHLADHHGPKDDAPKFDAISGTPTTPTTPTTPARRQRAPKTPTSPRQSPRKPRARKK